MAKMIVLHVQHAFFLRNLPNDDVKIPNLGSHDNPHGAVNIPFSALNFIRANLRHVTHLVQLHQSKIIVKHLSERFILKRKFAAATVVRS